jgi:hypothetical protein
MVNSLHRCYLTQFSKKHFIEMVYCWMKKRLYSFELLLNHLPFFSCSKALVLIQPFDSKSRLLQSVDGLLNQRFHDQ